MHPTQVHLQITVSQHSWIQPEIDDSNESVRAALVQFEHSTLPNHDGTRTVVLRYLKITPVKCVKSHYDGRIVQPKEGELHRRFTKRKGIKVTDKLDRNQLLVWSVNIDKPKGHMIRGLRLLWDA